MRRSQLLCVPAILLFCVLARDSVAVRSVPRAPSGPALPTGLEPYVPPGAAVARAAEPASEPVPAELTVEDIRALIASRGTVGCGANRLIDEKTGQPLPGQESAAENELRALGVAVFPVCEIILSDPGCTSEEVLGTAVVLSDLLYEYPVERERFVPLFVRRVLRGNGFAPDLPDATRGEIVRVLAEFGDEASAAALVPVLYEADKSLWVATAEALARTGGANELRALNAWVISHNPGDPYAVKVRHLRDRFEARLRATEALPGG